jgi:hypothetical protein
MLAPRGCCALPDFDGLKKGGSERRVMGDLLGVPLPAGAEKVDQVFLGSVAPVVIVIILDGGSDPRNRFNREAGRNRVAFWTLSASVTSIATILSMPSVSCAKR